MVSIIIGIVIIVLELVYSTYMQERLLISYCWLGMAIALMPSKARITKSSVFVGARIGLYVHILGYMFLRTYASIVGWTYNGESARYDYEIPRWLYEIIFPDSMHYNWIWKLGKETALEGIIKSRYITMLASIDRIIDVLIYTIVGALLALLFNVTVKKDAANKSL